MIAAWLTAARLCGALVTLHGAEVSPQRLCRAAVIIAHVADEWPPELLAAIAYRESRFDASAVNPRTGCWGALQVSTRRRVLTCITPQQPVRALTTRGSNRLSR